MPPPQQTPQPTVPVTPAAPYNVPPTAPTSSVASQPQDPAASAPPIVPRHQDPVPTAPTLPQKEGSKSTVNSDDPRLVNINEIGSNLGPLREEVIQFRGAKGSREFLTLEEKLTRQLLALDAIDTGGEEMVRSARKATVDHIQELLRILDNNCTQ